MTSLYKEEDWLINSLLIYVILLVTITITSLIIKKEREERFISLLGSKLFIFLKF